MDTISRQAAIDALKKEQAYYAHEDGAEIFYEYRHAIKALKNLPSAQPEIIRCKNCKWFEDIGCAIKIVDDTDKPSENDFCSFAERREE